MIAAARGDRASGPVRSSLSWQTTDGLKRDLGCWQALLALLEADAPRARPAIERGTRFLVERRGYLLDAAL
jgi:hypothetical protein